MEGKPDGRRMRPEPPLLTPTGRGVCIAAELIFFERRGAFLVYLDQLHDVRHSALTDCRQFDIQSYGATLLSHVGRSIA
jgi:hypothetical protein